MKMNSIKYLAWIAFLILATLVIGIHISTWKKADRHIEALNATLEANIVPISAQNSGVITALYISNNSFVKKGQLLFQVDPAGYENDITKAEENLKRVKEEVKKHQQEIIVAERLVNAKQHQISEASKMALLTSQDKSDADIKEPQGDLDHALKQLKVAMQKYGAPGYAQDKIDAAQAELDQARARLQQTKIVAPINGYVSDLNLNLGSHVVPQQPVLKLIENNAWWVIATFKPRDFNRIQRNLSCTVKFNSINYPLKGEVDKIQAQNVKIKLINAYGLPVKVGERAFVTIDLKNQAS